MDALRSRWSEDHFDQATQAWSFYCPQCKVPRRVKYRPQPSARHYVQVGLTAAFFTLLTWNWFHWKGFVSFLPIWTIFEVVYRAKVRAALKCERCGFDPFLYLVDVKRARVEIENHWRKKFEEKGIPYPSDTPAPGPAAPSLGASRPEKAPDPIAHP